MSAALVWSNPARDFAATYLNAGWIAHPIPFAEKGPKIFGWQSRTLPDAYNAWNLDFPENIPCNVGVLLGEPSGRLIDVDLDIPEAAWFADILLPPTCTFGRYSRPGSHRLYYCDLSTKQYKDPSDGKMLVELRSTGCQTVFPGSTHPSGEFVDFVRGTSAPQPIAPMDLIRGVERVAACAVMARHWPGSGRHLAQRAYSGALAQAA